MTKDTVSKIFISPVLASLFIGALLIKNTELAISFVKKGLESCFLTIIPSLFPFMIISEMISQSGVLSCSGTMSERLSRRTFGISGSAMSAVLLGLLLGFPMGTKALVSLYDRGEISQKELEHTLGFSGIPSFAFIVNAVGISLFGNRSFGIALYLSSIFSAVIWAIISKPKKSEYYTVNYQKPMIIKKSLSEIITSAISTATNSTILLCAYVIFFSAIVGCISNGIGLISTGGAILSAVLELSTGASSSAALGGVTGVALCGFTIGWSGLSVHFQTAALVGSRVKSYSAYTIAKLFQGLTCCLSAIVFSVFSNNCLQTPSSSFPAYAPLFPHEYTAVLVVFFFVCALWATKTHLRQKKAPSSKTWSFWSW